MVESVKITLLLCLTGITSCILFLSYGEYTNRYAIVTTQNNGIYIFDKKTVTLNKCENGKCEVIQANFPTDRLLKSSPVQAVPENVSNSTQNNLAIPTGANTQATQSQIVATTLQTGTNAQSNAVSTTLQPKVNSFLTSNDGLPTLQNSVTQTTNAYQA